MKTTDLVTVQLSLSPPLVFFSYCPHFRFFVGFLFFLLPSKIRSPPVSVESKFGYARLVACVFSCTPPGSMGYLAFSYALCLCTRSLVYSFSGVVLNGREPIFQTVIGSTLKLMKLWLHSLNSVPDFCLSFSTVSES